MYLACEQHRRFWPEQKWKLFLNVQFFLLWSTLIFPFSFIFTHGTNQEHSALLNFQKRKNLPPSWHMPISPPPLSERAITMGGRWVNPISRPPPPPLPPSKDLSPGWAYLHVLVHQQQGLPNPLCAHTWAKAKRRILLWIFRFLLQIFGAAIRDSIMRVLNIFFATHAHVWRFPPPPPIVQPFWVELTHPTFHSGRSRGEETYKLASPIPFRAQ